MRPLFLPLSVAILISCAPALPTATTVAIPSSETSHLIDQRRARRIEVTIYGPTDPRRSLAIIMPGYGMKQTDYGFLAVALLRRGYVVAAVQPHSATDPAVPGGDNLAIRRRPWWKRGADDAHFVAGHLRSRQLARSGPILLVGHSHGGDIAMLFATEHPKEVAAVFTLDNRRMPMPRLERPRICSARSSDMSADPGVIPSAAEQERLGMVIVPLSATRHDDMFDGASASQKAAILSVLGRCLERAR